MKTWCWDFMRYTPQHYGSNVLKTARIGVKIRFPWILRSIISDYLLYSLLRSDFRDFWIFDEVPLFRISACLLTFRRVMVGYDFQQELGLYRCWMVSEVPVRDRKLVKIAFFRLFWTSCHHKFLSQTFRACTTPIERFDGMVVGQFGWSKQSVVPRLPLSGCTSSSMVKFRLFWYLSQNIKYFCQKWT